MQVFTCLSHRNRIPFDATSSLLDQNEGQGPFSGASAPPLGASPSSISTHQRLSAVAPAYIYIYTPQKSVNLTHPSLGGSQQCGLALPGSGSGSINLW